MRATKLRYAPPKHSIIIAGIKRFVKYFFQFFFFVLTYEEIRSIVTSVSLMGTAEKCKGQKRMGQILSVMESILEWIWDNLYIINVVFAIAIVFFQRKSPKEV